MNNVDVWVEKYRPTDLDEIVLEPLNKTFFNNIIEKNYIPNLLFYGPPGTGKTTTIMSLISKYFLKNKINHNGLILHLNASDERGIDVIRNQINQFVNSKTLFENGLKFVILDEVDYMTKNAQYALRYLIQSSYNINVCFCLICNYISKIECSLKNEFICIRFNQLPSNKIHSFLKMILEKEKLFLNDKVIYVIQQKFHSDIRSMINYLQSNIILNDNKLEENKNSINIIENKIIQNIIDNALNEPIDVIKFRKIIYDITVKYNIDKKEFMKDCFQYIIRNSINKMNNKNILSSQTKITNEFLDFVEILIHFNEKEFNEFVDYFYSGFFKGGVIYNIYNDSDCSNKPCK